MGNIFDNINRLPILEVLDAFGIGYKKKGTNYYLLKDDGSMDTSFSVSVSKNMVKDFGKTGIEGGVFDFIGLYHNFPKEAMRTQEGRATTLKLFTDKGLVKVPEKTREFVPSLKDNQIFDKFDDLKLNGYKQEISAFLMTRGVEYDFIQRNTLLLGEIFKDIGFYDSYYCTETKDGNEKPTAVPVFLFPCYNSKKEVIGLKVRRKDGKTIRGIKSHSIGKVGLLYDKIDKDLMYICEGEMDYVIMRILGYNNVVANEGGVQSLQTPLKSILAETEKVVCLYDNDKNGAGQKGKESLVKTFKRPIYEIEYPMRESQDGKPLSDVNDLYEVGYDNKTKWDKIFDKAIKIGEGEEVEHLTDFVYIRESMEYYDMAYKKMRDGAKVATHLGCTQKELSAMRTDNKIKTYTDLCYHYGGKPNHYNTMNEDVIINDPGDAEAVLHPDIEYLINNVCNNNKENSEWLHKAILYKLTHINDPFMPALILYGPQGSGKGSLLNLLSKLFGDDNLQTGLGMKELKGTHDAYQGEKLIVEYKEVSSGNTQEDKLIADRIKGIVSERYISVRALYKNARTIENRAWFHFSSNHSLPLQMDSGESGNRRYTIIKTGHKLDREKGYQMNEVTFKSIAIIKQYVAWLYETYPDVVNLTHLEALDNEDKQTIVGNCESASNLFFQWLERKYPHISKITNKEKNTLLDMYCHDVGEDKFDIKFKQKNFDTNLSHRYEKKNISVRGKTVYGYLIHKTEFDKEHIPDEAGDVFKEGELNNLIFTN